jgi:lysozyme family protein
MTRFEKFIPIIFTNEGILSDNVNDAGGLTKYGISQKSYPNLDIRNLTKQQAEGIYKHDYYDVCRIDMIENELLALHVFDMAVNAGIGRTIRMLQRVILVDVDGVMGEKTINTTNAANWAPAFIQARINYYKQIATGRNLVFLNGWLNRVQNTTKAL